MISVIAVDPSVGIGSVILGAFPLVTIALIVRVIWCDVRSHYIFAMVNESLVLHCISLIMQQWLHFY